MKSCNKGQVATEFFAYSSIFLLLVMITATAVFVSQGSENAFYENQYVLEAGGKFSSAFNLAVSSGKGFNYTIEFPKYLLGHPYNVSFIENNYILIEWSGPNGNFAYPYAIDKFDISFSGNCISFPYRPDSNAGVISSNLGKNTVTFINDGDTITIKQEGGCQ